jgi:hypothetical protein
MRTTFVNQNSEKNIIEEGKKHLQSRAANLTFYMTYGTDAKEDEAEFIDRVKEQDFDSVQDMIDELEKFNDNAPFHEYGLSFDYVELGTFDDQDEDYFRFQFSWGGPSEELRIYEDGTIIFVYLDWFSGVGFDVSDEDWAEWIAEWFKSCDMLNFETKREGYDYYEIQYRLENPDEDEAEDDETEDDDDAVKD